MSARKKKRNKHKKTANDKENDSIMTCYNCKTIYKIAEVEISQEEYNFMNENRISGYVWVCPTCMKEPQKQFVNFENKINKKLDEIQKQVEADDIKSKVDGLEKYIDLKLQKLEEQFCIKVDKQKESLNKNITSFAKTVSSNADKNITVLNKEFNSLKSNIIIIIIIIYFFYSFFFT